MSPESSRRDFVRTLALGASAGALAGDRPALADDPDDKKKDDEPKEEPPKTEADTRMELVLARFGKQLDADARKSVRSEIDSIVRRAEALRKIPLTNGDGPYPIFKPYRAPLS
ncbi:MAG TPA: hypothetical protein VGZ22_26880 [Isosphaeraceae bacterium]|jgi:hypothetical protein|nr:hypothetical protein [Isosphaeraceae bacterium]